MRLTVTSDDDNVFPLDVSDDLEVENLKAFCEAETGIQAEEMVVLFNGVPLDDGKKILSSYGVKDGDVIFLHRKGQARRPPAPAAAAGAAAASSPTSPGHLQLPDFSAIKVPGAGAPSTSQGRSSSSSRGGGGEDDPKFIKEMLKANPDQLSLLRQNNPRLAEAYDSGSLEEFTKVLKEQQEARAERERMRIRMLTADPFDMEAQRLIAQEIENKNIDQNMELAMEYNPESFATVVMLYIDCIVNGHHIKAFVDSGAQATIMSQSAAERCGIMRLVDRRWAGIAKGVGVQKIIGRVHMAQIQIGDDYLTSSFSILEEQPMDMLLGLDMLKRHQCVIDLKENVLVIGTTGARTTFLSEAELPECARLSSKGLDEAMKASTSAEEERLLQEALAKSQAESTKRLKSDESSSSASSPSSATATAVLPTDSFTEENVQALMKYGFPRDKCVEELRRFGGDMKQATAALFAKSLKF